MAFRRDPSERWTAGQLLSHKWLQDAKLAQEKSRRNLVSIENAQKAVDSAKIRRKSLLIQQRAGFSKRLQLEAELGLGLNEGKNSNELSNAAAAAATSKSKGHRTKTKRAASSKELNDLLLATSTQSKELSVLDDLRGMLDDSIGNGNNSGSSNSSASARPAPTSASSGPSSGSETPAGASPVVQRREKQWHRKMTIGPIKEYESGSGKGGVEGAGGSEGNVEAGGAGRHKRKLTMSQLIEQENVDGDGEFAEWLELESASGNDKDTLMRENREFLQEKITEVYAKLRGSNGNGNNSYGYSGGSGGYGYGSSGIGGSIGNSGGSISGSGGSGSGSLGGGGLKDGEYFKLLEGLIDSVNEYAMVKEAAFEQVGMWPLVELLIEAPLKQETLQFYTIKTINKVVEGSGALMKMLGDCGGIVPMAYFISSPSQGVIDEVITFYEQMVGKSSELFLACNGVHYILTLLKTVYNNPMYGPDLTVSVLKIVLDTLNAEKGRPFFDVARTYLREGLLQSLVSIATGFKTNLEVGNLVGAALLAMARSDEVIKAWMCRREFVRGVWGLLEDGPETFRVSLLKAIELIAYTRENVELLAAEGAVKVLFDQLPRCGASPSLRHHIFAALRNIVSLNRDRQCELVGLGIVRQLCADVAEPGLKDDVIPFLCSLLKAVKKRDEFERNNVADVFIALLADPAYHQKAIESLAWWLEKDAAYVRSKIGHDRIMRALASTVTHSNLWPQLMDPVLRMIRKSKTIAQKLGAQENFVNFVLRKLKKSSTEQIRTLLDILAVLCQRAKAKSDFVTKNNILEKLASLREIHSSKVVVASSIDELIEAIKTQQQQQQQ